MLNRIIEAEDMWCIFCCSMYIPALKQIIIGKNCAWYLTKALLLHEARQPIQRPDSLCVQVLKARYDLNGAIISDTVFSGNASSTWHSIECGLQFLNKGLIWQIGSGTKVLVLSDNFFFLRQVWSDNWIPQDMSLGPISRQGWCRWLLMGVWQRNLLQQYFGHPLDTWGSQGVQIGLLQAGI